MKKYELVIFDLDGTLLDTSEGVLSSVMYTVKEMNLKKPDTEILDSFIGPPVQRRFKELYALSDDEAMKAANIFRNHYKEIDLLKAKPYEGIYKVFEKLEKSGIKTAVATYKRQDYTNIILHHFGFDNYTKVIYGSDFEGKLNKKDIILLCLNHVEISETKKVLMVGDTINDAVGAAELGIDFLAVKYGFGFKSDEDVEMIQNVGSISSVDEALDWFEE